jgi:hypothetical protein
MKLAIIGAAGNVGRCLVAEALSRGHDVTAIEPTLSKLEALEDVTAKKGDVTEPDSLAGALAGHDAVMSAVPSTRYEPRQLLEAVRKSGVRRLAVVGGSGSLTAPEGGLVMDRPNFPGAVRAAAMAGLEMLDALREVTDLDWTYLSSSTHFSAGKRTGEFRLGKDELLVDANGQSHISFEDYAVALLDEIEGPRHTQERFTVGY